MGGKITMHSATYSRRRRVSLTYVNRPIDSRNVERGAFCCAPARGFGHERAPCGEETERGAATLNRCAGNFVVPTSSRSTQTGTFFPSPIWRLHTTSQSVHTTGFSWHTTGSFFLSTGNREQASGRRKRPTRTGPSDGRSLSKIASLDHPQTPSRPRRIRSSIGNRCSTAGNCPVAVPQCSQATLGDS
jgi:hypothetical protein